ncbi:MAG: HEPN domain-containing protein [Rubrobacter sp.]|nr:HEPN domain-containing protein [Rubrobacter sp.]
MSDPERIEETGRWIRFAREDLEIAELILEQGSVPRAACFNAQQAAEKALKALLIARDKDFPKTHELFGLSRLLPEDFDVGVTDEELVSLGKWAVQPRYPGDLPDATREDARAAVKQARVIFETALKDLEDHGYDQKEERDEPDEEDA